MADPGRQTPRSSQRSKVIRSQKIQTMFSPTEEEQVSSRGSSTAKLVAANAAAQKSSGSEDNRRRREERDRSASTASTSSANTSGGGTGSPMPPIVRSHTPGHLASKSQDRRRKPSELSIRQRSQSSSSLSAAAAIGGSTSLSGISPSPSHLSVASPPTTSRTPAPPLPLTSSASTPATRSPHRGGSAANLSDHLSNGGGSGGESPAQGQVQYSSSAEGSQRRPTAMRSTSAIASKPSVYGSIVGSSTATRVGGGSSGNKSSRGTPRSASRGRGGSTAGKESPGYTPFPPLIDPNTASDVQPVPSSGMYWSRAPVSGVPHTKLRAHTTTLIGSNVFIFGGCDARTCFNELYVLDADSFHWTKPHVVGEIPLPLRAMTCTAVGKKLVVFGGGDGPEYYNDVYVLDTTNFRWSRPRIAADRPRPSRRRAHTACLYKNGIYMFGGGDGVRALNDVWRLDVNDTTKMAWKLISGVPPPPASSPAAALSTTGVDHGSSSDPGGHGAAIPGSSLPANGKDIPKGGGGASLSTSMSSSASTSLAMSASLNTMYPHLINQPRPKARGYHTANMVGSKLIIFGGSDGGECFNDVWVYDVETHLWRAVAIPTTYRRLSHTATIVGSYLFVVGGHDGNEYSNEVLLLNLVTMSWDRRKVYGQPPSGRGYHGTVLYDSRLLVIGGFDGGEVFGDVWALELAVHAYYSQISHFSIDV